MFIWIMAAFIVAAIFWLQQRKKMIEGYSQKGLTYQHGVDYPDNGDTIKQMKTEARYCLNECMDDKTCERFITDRIDGKPETNCWLKSTRTGPDKGIPNPNRFTFTKRDDEQNNSFYTTRSNMNTNGKLIIELNTTPLECKEACSKIDKCQAYFTSTKDRENDPDGMLPRACLLKEGGDVTPDPQWDAFIRPPYGYCPSQQIWPLTPKVDENGSSCMMKFLPVQKGVKFTGTELFHYDKSSVEDCAKTCQMTKNCTGYSMGNNNTTCYVHSDASKTSSDANLDTYVVAPYEKCKTDPTLNKMNKEGSNCPKPYGMCSDDVTVKDDKVGSNCLTPFTWPMQMQVNPESIGTFKNSNSFQECESECRKNDKCVAYTLDENKTCSLKDKITEIKFNASLQSGIKSPYGVCNYGNSNLPKVDPSGSNCSSTVYQREGIDYPGNDINTHKDVDPEGVCGFYCTLNEKCKGYTYNSETKECSLKSKMVNAKVDKNMSSTITQNFGFCADGATLKGNALDGNCFGYCPSDDWSKPSILKADEAGSNCADPYDPEKDFGYCLDGKTKKTDALGSKCFGWCPNNDKIWKIDASGSNCFGPCENDPTVAKMDLAGTNCFGWCDDDEMQWKMDATGSNCLGYGQCTNDLNVWKTDVAGSNCFGLCPDGTTYKKSADDPCTPLPEPTSVKKIISAPIDNPSSLLSSSLLTDEDETVETKTTYDMLDPVFVGFTTYEKYPERLKKPLQEKYIKDQWFPK